MCYYSKNNSTAETRDNQCYFCCLEQVWINKGQKQDFENLGNYGYGTNLQTIYMFTFVDESCASYTQNVKDKLFSHHRPKSTSDIIFWIWVAKRFFWSHDYFWLLSDG